MDDRRLNEWQRQTRQRQQEEERRRRTAAVDLRQQQERQAQDEARLAQVPPANEQHHAQLPRPSHTGVR